MRSISGKIIISMGVSFFSIQAMACSNSFCVNSEMPLLAQNSTRLVSAISRLERDSSIKRDPGWCAPVASTMALAGSLKKSKNMSYSNAKLNAMRNHDVNWNSHINSGTFADAIYQVGEIMKTNWRKGGTKTNNTHRAFKSIYNSIRGNVSKNYIQKVTKHSSYNVSYFKNLFKGKFPAASMIVKKTDRRRKFITGHVLALHGYEGSTLKIYDPWGRIYNVNLSSTGSRSYPRMNHVKGSQGSIKSYNRGSNYASLYSFASFSVSDRSTYTNPRRGRRTRPVTPPRRGGRGRYLP